MTSMGCRKIMVKNSKNNNNCSDNLTSENDFSLSDELENSRIFHVPLNAEIHKKTRPYVQDPDGKKGVGQACSTKTSRKRRSTDKTGSRTR